jgi:hypothetical protein
VGPKASDNLRVVSKLKIFDDHCWMNHVRGDFFGMIDVSLGYSLFIVLLIITIAHKFLLRRLPNDVLLITGGSGDGEDDSGLSDSEDTGSSDSEDSGASNSEDSGASDSEDSGAGDSDESGGEGQLKHFTKARITS